MAENIEERTPINTTLFSYYNKKGEDVFVFTGISKEEENTLCEIISKMWRNGVHFAVDITEEKL